MCVCGAESGDGAGRPAGLGLFNFNGTSGSTAPLPGAGGGGLVKLQPQDSSGGGGMPNNLQQIQREQVFRGRVKGSRGVLRRVGCSVRGSRGMLRRVWWCIRGSKGSRVVWSVWDCREYSEHSSCFAVALGRGSSLEAQESRPWSNTTTPPVGLR